MQKIGNITNTTDPGGEFTDGNVAQGIPPTLLPAALFNTWQRELIKVIESAGITLDPQDFTQLAQAIKKHISTEVPIASLTTAGITQLSSATHSDSETMAATPKAVKTLAAQTLAKDQNGADIPDKAQFVDNLGLSVAVVPIGVPLPWPTGNPPAGWIACDGKAFDKKTCPQLAAVYPSGKTPDLRGEFIRGWDNGRNVDSGRVLLGAQGDAIRNITGFVSGEGLVFDGFSGAFYDPGSRDAHAQPSGNKVNYSDDFSFDASRVVPTANENRPRNIAFNYIVRAA